MFSLAQVRGDLGCFRLATTRAVTALADKEVQNERCQNDDALGLAFERPTIGAIDRAPKTPPRRPLRNLRFCWLTANRQQLFTIPENPTVCRGSKEVTLPYQRRVALDEARASSVHPRTGVYQPAGGQHLKEPDLSAYTVNTPLTGCVRLSIGRVVVLR